MLSLLNLALDQSALEPITIGLTVAFLVISLGVHEAAHGWVALKCGDSTARDMGRITLNPFAHIDLMMTIVVPIICMVTMGFPFGGAKPVPVNFRALRHPVRDMALVALAGPASNFLLAILFFVIRKLLLEQGGWPAGSVGDRVIDLTVKLNLILAAFNMLPVPPLDGSRIMAWLLPEKLRSAYVRLEPFGLLIVIILVFKVPAVNALIWQSVDWMYEGVKFVGTAGGAW